jgi:hypothetical protein
MHGSERSLVGRSKQHELRCEESAADAISTSNVVMAILHTLQRAVRRLLHIRAQVEHSIDWHGAC